MFPAIETVSATLSLWNPKKPYSPSVIQKEESQKENDNQTQHFN